MCASNKGSISLNLLLLAGLVSMLCGSRAEVFSRQFLFPDSVERRLATGGSSKVWEIIYISSSVQNQLLCVLYRIKQLTKEQPIPSAIPVKRSNQLSYQANWELVIQSFVHSY